MNINHSYSFETIESFPEIPQLSIPNYSHLNASFRKALLDPRNGAYAKNKENGHPNFGAYLMSNSNEMVTWGILAVGEKLCARETDWIAITYKDFFDYELNLFLNSPGMRKIEYWYLFYSNTLAGAVQRSLYKNDSDSIRLMGLAADTMHKLAQKIDYDFNNQGYDFFEDSVFTKLDVYRQPDSIAGYAYNMLFAALRAQRPQYYSESIKAIKLYEKFEHNPWYEIPNGSAGLLASAWLNAHGEKTDVYKSAAWLFDHSEGPLQIGKWGDEEINGLMMGWRGDTRKDAMNSAYSMESLMPVQFILPSVRYCPQLADNTARYMLNVLSNFQLFYAHGTKPLYETKAELDPAVPYERLERELDWHTPAACGDFHGHRSIYGAGYLCWMQALALKTNDSHIFAYDLSLTDWLAEKTYPVYLLRNPHEDTRHITFDIAEVWKQIHPSLFEEKPVYWDMETLSPIDENVIAVKAKESRIIAVLPKGITPQINNGIVCADGVELCVNIGGAQ